MKPTKKHIIYSIIPCLIISVTANTLAANPNQKTQNTKQIIHIWPGKVPGETKPKAPAQKRNSSTITVVTDPTLHSFPAANPNGTAVLVCPGGGYRYVSFGKEGKEIAQWLNSIGISAFVLQYRVPNKKEGAIQDAQRALRIIRNQASQLHIKKIGVIGFSAGGDLATKTLFLSEQETYKPQDNIDKLSCKPDFAMLVYPAYLDHGPNKTLSTYIKPSPKTPPVFVFVAEDDHYAHSSHTLVNAGKKANMNIEFHSIPKGGHGYGLRKNNAAGKMWPPLAEKWLKNLNLI